MSQDRTLRRLIRRETHSSRALPSIICACILMLVFLWLALEAVLWILSDQPLLASPAQMFQWLIGLPAATLPAGMAAAGAGLGILGLVLLGAALGKGRKARRSVAGRRAAVVVDDDVIAAAVSSTARLAANLAPGQVTTTIGGRSVRVQARPTSGVPLDRQAITTAVDDELAALALDRRVSSSIRILDQGAVGQ
jgi:hypothetical protein